MSSLSSKCNWKVKTINWKYFFLCEFEEGKNSDGNTKLVLKKIGEKICSFTKITNSKVVIFYFVQFVSNLDYQNKLTSTNLQYVKAKDIVRYSI